MVELKTSDVLLSSLKRAARHQPSAEELRKQRVSFIMGSLSDDSTVTRAQIIRSLEDQEGRKTAE